MPTEKYVLREQEFNWDRDKNISNIEKHGISFKMAALAFFDPYAARYEDFRHSQDEDRFMIVGFGANRRLLTVCHCYREGDTIIRIISARKATKSEQKLYGGAF